MNMFSKKIKVFSLAIVIIAASVFSIYFYVQYSSNKKIENSKREAEQESFKEALQEQQDALDDTKQELLKTKNELNALANKPAQTIIQKETTKSSEITSNEIKPLLYGVVNIDCNFVFGSGSLWNLDGEYFVLTNNHVVNQGSYKGSYCSIPAFSLNGGLGTYVIYTTQGTRWNTKTDISVLKLHSLNQSNPNIDTLDYKIGELQKCPTPMEMGSPVVALGYPIYGQGNSISLIATNGIISGFIGGSVTDGLPYPNYIVSAKIDNGNLSVRSSCF